MRIMEHASQTSAATANAGVPLWGQDLSGRTLGEFQVLRRLGQGGMGQVYLAEQVSLKRKVALKLLRPDWASNPTSLQRFRLEAEAVAKATHANIVQVYAIGEFEGLHYMALEYIDGRNLREFVARKGPPETLLALSIMRQTASGLQRAAELGIIHRDIKPENILLTRKGEVKVADFGLSRILAGDQETLHLTQSGVTMGTPLYMSPEQVEGRPLDPRSDIYSFGVTCYHMLAGRPPFHGANAFEVALQHVQAEPTPLEQVRPDLPLSLCGIVRKMMAKKPEDRYQTCRDLLRDLVRVREGLSGVAAGQSVALLDPGDTPEQFATQPVKPAYRRRWLPFLVAASLVLAAVSGAALAWWQRHKEFPTSAASVTDASVEALFSQQKREQFLKDAVEQYADPGTDAARIRLGLGHCIELAVFYLDQWRLADADELFTRLQRSPVETYASLGRLGHAIVLGLQNKPAESNEAFREAARSVKGPRNRGILLENPQLAQWVARALDYNFANAPADFPRQLQFLRTPWGNPAAFQAQQKPALKQ
jgi:serine/threonine-protein kinase